MADISRTAKFTIGQVVKHRYHPFRGIIFDVDPVYDNTEEWWEAIKENPKPRKDQPFYHLLAESPGAQYVAYVSEQNLILDISGEPIHHPNAEDLLEQRHDGTFHARSSDRH